ncbi:E1-E2 ATPase-like protein 7 [Elsinoe fawcettii]|nr:E1-E2 ATPase-like protein 7 [Elsinoe fawcettii]
MDASKDSCCAARVVRSDLSKPDTFAACKTTGDSTASTEKLRTKGKIDDIERGAAKQHVLLNISGMTCTGCVRKVMNVLGGVSGISAPKVTFVSGVAEFDIASNTNLRSVINELEKGTGFSCSQIVSKFQSLDLISAVALPMTNKAELPDGIESIERLDKHTYRVNYDPVIVGARSLRSTFEGATLAPPSNDAMLREGKKRLVNMGWSTVVSAALTIPIVVLSWSDNPVPEDTRLIVSLVLGTLVQGIAIPEFYVGAIKSLIYSRMIEMDMLVVISITAAYGYSVVAFALHFAGVTLVEEAFFETSALLITLVLLGRFMAALARIRAVSAVSVRSLQAEKAHVIQPSGDSVEMDARLLQFGDVFMVLPHALIPTDGDVVAGTSSVDESMITGESVPVPKGKGDGLIAGTINGPGTMKVKLTRLPGKNSITDIANMVENALGAKPRIQDLADKVASWFIPSVIALATIVLAIWIAVGLRVRKLDGGDSFGVAITYSIAVLAVSCPCALGLAVPMVLVIAGGVTARQGVIVKSADAIERGHKITDVIFDKTGTLTKGDLVVVHTAMFAAPDSTLPERAVLGAIHALTKNNDHPVSRAVAESTKLRSSTSVEITNIESVPGAGVKAMFMGCTIKAGNPYWLELDHHPDISALIDHGMTLLCVTANEELVAVFGLKSNLRPEAADVIRKLKSRNLACHIVSGDGPQVVRNVADSVGVPFSTAMSRHKPAEKQAYVQSLMDDGKVVLFCGDGTNDAIAVAQANVGVQIGNASDVTKATADVVLLGGLDGILVLLDVSKRSFRRIVFNFVWSAVYNVFAILLAAGAFVRVRIPPAYAGLGEIVSVLPVILAAMTLSRTKTKASSA